MEDRQPILKVSTSGSGLEEEDSLVEVSYTDEKLLKSPSFTFTLPNLSSASRRFTRLNTFLLEAVKHRDVHEIERLIKSGANPNATCGIDCVSVCHLAAMRSDDALTILLDAGAERQRLDRLGRTPLHLAAWAGHVRQIAVLLGFSKVQELPKDEDTDQDAVRHQGQGIRLDLPTISNNGATVNPICTAAFVVNGTSGIQKRLRMRQSLKRVRDLNTHLIELISEGDTLFMSRIIADGANPNATCRLDHVSACHIAAMHDNDALELLISYGADTSRSDQHGRTPLHLAAWMGNVKQIALLLNFPEAEIVEVMTKCLKLTMSPCRRDVELTLPDEWSDGVGHNCRDVKKILPVFQEGWMPLHAASARAQHHCVQLLLAYDADPSAKDHLHRTPLDVTGWAHYSGYIIDVDDFMKTIDLLLKAGGKFLKCSDESNLLDTPLHTAVELGSEAAVKLLLQGGASATEWNSRGLTAMHMCVEKRNKELLQLLANHKCNEGPPLVTVDVKDRPGSNVLCAAVKAEWIEGVCIALDAGASIATKANEESPMHIAAQLGNIDILQKILNSAQDRNINYCNEDRATALFIAISHNHQDVLEWLLKNGFSIDTENLNKTNVFHIATKHGRKEILEYLLGYDCNFIHELMINISDHFGPPLYYAIEKNHPDCAVLLISKGAQVNIHCRVSSRFMNFRKITTLLHIAARKNHCEIAEMIIKVDSKTVHVPSYGLGWTPLHEACHYGNREMIVLLLRKGADLSGIDSNAHPDTPIALLMKYVSKPTAVIEEVFDSCIAFSQDKSHQNGLMIEVDYTVVDPPSENVDRSHMRVIQALLDTGNTYDQQKLLLHPLVESFLFLQWRSLLPFFYSLMAFHLCFALSLNVFALSLFWYKDRKIYPVPNIFRSSVWIYIIYLSAFFITIQDIFFLKRIGKRNLRYLETWLRFLSTAMAVALPLIISWDSESHADWVRLFSAATLFFTWVKIMFLFSRFPEFGYYVLMFVKVAKRVIKILMAFSFLVFGFAISFMIQFRAERPFEGPWASFLMTTVMMTSELGYQDTFNNERDLASLIMLRVTFTVFLFFVSIVLMNLLVGVAVNDVNNLEVLGNIKRLEKQVEFITAFEGTACRNFVKKILPARLYKKWFEDMQWQNFIKMRSRSDNKSMHSNIDHLPARLREAIFEKAQLQNTQSDEQQGTALNQKKLDEIYRQIGRLASLETAINKIFKEIYKLRVENADGVPLKRKPKRQTY